MVYRLEPKGSTLVLNATVNPVTAFDPWSVCLFGFLKKDRVLQHCPLVSAQAWPICYQRLTSLFTLIDPTYVFNQQYILHTAFNSWILCVPNTDPSVIIVPRCCVAQRHPRKHQRRANAMLCLDSGRTKSRWPCVWCQQCPVWRCAVHRRIWV